MQTELLLLLLLLLSQVLNFKGQSIKPSPQAWGYFNQGSQAASLTAYAV